MSKPIATSLKALRGTVRHPRKTRSRPSHIAEIGPAPHYLDPAQKAVWKELSQCLPPYSATYHDRPTFELAVRMTVRLREPGVRVSPSFIGQLRSLLGSFGLSPLIGNGWTHSRNGSIRRVSTDRVREIARLRQRRVRQHRGASPTPMRSAFARRAVARVNRRRGSPQCPFNCVLAARRCAPSCSRCNADHVPRARPQARSVRIAPAAGPCRGITTSTTWKFRPPVDFDDKETPPGQDLR